MGKKDTTNKQIKAKKKDHAIPKVGNALRKRWIEERKNNSPNYHQYNHNEWGKLACKGTDKNTIKKGKGDARSNKSALTGQHTLE